MDLFKKTITAILILIVAVIDIKIIVEYKIVKPSEKYQIIDQKKTVAKVINLDNVHPEEVVETVEIEEAQEEIEVDNNQTEEESIQENSTQNEQSSENIDQQSVSYINSNSIVEPAMQYLNYKYVSGGSSPETGFDCSGFTKYIYGLFGINLNRVSSEQADNGTPISKEELQPGDLVLFKYYGSSSIGHTGIYIGNGNFIHAANSSRGVVIDTIESGYYLDNYVTARRFF